MDQILQIDKMNLPKNEIQNFQQKILGTLEQNVILTSKK